MRRYNRDVNDLLMTQSNFDVDYGNMGPLNRLSPSSSTSSCQDVTQNVNFDGSVSTGKLKKRSTSTNSGLKSLGRIFGGSSKKAKDLRFILQLFLFVLFLLNFRRNIVDTGAYSDSEVSSMGGADAMVPSTSTAFSLKGNSSVLADYDKRKKKKHELLEEVIFF